MLALRRQRLIAQMMCYGACWMALGLGAMWIWLGSLSIGKDVLRNAIFNPVLILDGSLVLVSAYFIAKRSRMAVVFITIYAVSMEAFLQWYQWHNFGYVKFKPYFIFEALGLAFANIGVFWYHHANKRIKKPTKKRR